MATVLRLLLFFATGLAVSVDFYSLNLAIPGGGQVPLSGFANHKTIIVVFNPSSGDYSHLQMLDSILLDSPQVKIVAIPANEFASADTTELAPAIPDSIISHLRDSLALSLTMTSAMYVKKNDSTIQSQIAVWLTHTDQNRHFDRDVDADGQIYLVNERGVLYAIMDKGVLKSDVEQHLSAIINE